MKETLLLQKRLILLLWILLAQPIGAQDPEGKLSFGDPSELRDLETIHIAIVDTSTGKPTKSIFAGRVLYNKIRSPIQKELPVLRFAPTGDSADIRILYGQSATSTGRNKAVGLVFRSTGLESASLLMEFKSSTDNKWSDTPAETFVATFIKAYRKANANTLSSVDENETEGMARVASGAISSSIAGAHDKVTGENGKLTTNELMQPPELLTPNSIKPVVAVEGATTKIQFTWSPVPQAVAYKIKISNSSVFSKNIREETVRQETLYVTSGFGEGTYYWTVRAISADNKASRDSDPNKFTVVNKAFREKETDVFLDVKIIRISNIFEIIGRTDPGAAVVINEEPVTSMSADGSFKHFTSPLPHSGKNLITITAQDRTGNAKTLTKEVYVD